MGDRDGLKRNGVGRVHFDELKDTKCDDFSMEVVNKIYS